MCVISTARSPRNQGRRGGRGGGNVAAPAHRGQTGGTGRGYWNPADRECLRRPDRGGNRGVCGRRRRQDGGDHRARRRCVSGRADHRRPPARATRTGTRLVGGEPVVAADVALLFGETVFRAILGAVMDRQHADGADAAFPVEEVSMEAASRYGVCERRQGDCRSCGGPRRSPIESRDDRVLHVHSRDLPGVSPGAALRSRGVRASGCYRSVDPVGADDRGGRDGELACGCGVFGGSGAGRGAAGNRADGPVIR